MIYCLSYIVLGVARILCYYVIDYGTPRCQRQSRNRFGLVNFSCCEICGATCCPSVTPISEFLLKGSSIQGQRRDRKIAIPRLAIAVRIGLLISQRIVEVIIGDRPDPQTTCR